MMIQCPRCSTRWRVANTSASENPVFKCGRCQHLFREFPGAPADARAATGKTTRASTAAEPNNLEFIFPERPTGRDTGEPARAAAPEAAPPATPPTRTTASAPPAGPPSGDAPTIVVGREPPPIILHHDDPEPDAFMLGDEAEDEPTVTTAPAPAPQELRLGAAAAEPDFDDLDDDEEDGADAFRPSEAGPALRVEEIVRPRNAFGLVTRGLVTLVALHAVLAVLVRAAPDHAGSLLARIPLLGAGFARDPALTGRVQLKNVRGRYERLSSGRTAFVIVGDAVNASDTTLARVEVEGAIYRASGEVDRRVVIPTDRTSIRELPDSMIVFLQDFRPDRTIAPGESARFLVAFLAPPPDLQEFSSRVVAVRPTRRASAPTTAPPSRRASVG